MTKSIVEKENTIKVTFDIPESIHDQIIDMVSDLMKKRKKTVTKTDVAIEILTVGLANIK